MPLSHFIRAIDDRLNGAEPLKKVAAKFPTVSIGSYPSTESNQGFGVKLVLQSRDTAALKAAKQGVQEDVETFEPNI